MDTWPVSRMPSKSQTRPLLYVLLGALFFLYLEVFILPAVPLVPIGDVSIFLLDATRMLHGQVIYRDLFDITTPGTPLVYAGLFKLFGVRAWIPDAMLVLLGVCLFALSIAISRKLMRGPAVFLGGLLFLTFAYRSALDGTHHWYSTLAAIAALAVLVERRTPQRLAIAGALCGLAGCFTQTEGLASVVGFAAFLLWERYRNRQPGRSLLRNAVYLFVPFVTVTVAFNAYFAWKAGLGRFLYCTVVFVTKYYQADRFNSWRVYLREIPSIHRWVDWPALGIFLSVHWLIPMVYLLFLVRYRRDAAARSREPWDRLMLVSVTGFFMFLSVAPAASYLRLCSVSLPAFILLVWFAQSPGRLERALLYGLWLAALLLMVSAPATRQTDWRAYLDLPTGRTVFLHPLSYSKTRWVFQRSKPGDFFFGDPLITFALGLRDPAEVNFINTTDYTRPAQVQNLLAALEANPVRFVMWYPGLDRSAAVDRAGDHLEPLRAYLRSHYHVARVFANFDEVWERNP